MAEVKATLVWQWVEEKGLFSERELRSALRFTWLSAHTLNQIVQGPSILRKQQGLISIIQRWLSPCLAFSRLHLRVFRLPPEVDH